MYNANPINAIKSGIKYVASKGHATLASPLSSLEQKIHSHQEGRTNNIKYAIGSGIGIAAVIAGVALYYNVFKNDPPVISDISIPQNEVVVGDTANIDATATDKHGATVLGVITRPDGKIETITLDEAYPVDQKGMYHVKIKATDGKNKSTIVDAGSFNAVENTINITCYRELPKSMYVGDIAKTTFDASDKKGGLEVTVTSELQDKSTPIDDITKIDEGSYELVVIPKEPGMTQIIVNGKDFLGNEVRQVLGEIMVYSQKILDDGVPPYVKTREEFDVLTKTEGTSIDGLVLRIGGFGIFHDQFRDYTLEKTGNNLWETTEEISIDKKGSYKWKLMFIINNIEQPIIGDTGILTVTEPSKDDGGPELPDPPF